MRSIHAAALLAGLALCSIADAQRLVLTNASPTIELPLDPSSTLYVVSEAGVPYFVPAASLIEVRAACLLDPGGQCVIARQPLGEGVLQLGTSDFAALAPGTSVEWFDGSTSTVVGNPRYVAASCVVSGPGCLGLAPPPAPPSVTLAASASQVEVGSPLTLWSTAANAAGCERFAIGPQRVPAWSGDGPSTSSVTFELAAPGTYSFTLRCYNSGGETSSTSGVTALAAPPPPCSAPPALARLAAPSTYPELFGAPFANTAPGAVDLAPDQYSAIAITIPAGTGGEGFFVVSAGASTAQAALTLTSCAGNFSFATIPPECSRIGNGKVLPWRVGGSQPGVCTLEPGRTYYLNATFRDLLLAPTCVAAQCRAAITQSNVSVTQPIPPIGSALALVSLGASIAVAGDVMVAGLPDIEQSTGRAYVYRKSGGAAGWAFEAALRAGGEAIGDGFGTAVSVSADGRTILVGAPYDDHDGLVDAGSARIFRIAGASWADSPIEEVLIAADAASGDRYGTAVDVSPAGAAFVIGAPEKDGGTGSAYSFKSSAPAGASAKSGATRTQPIPRPRGKSTRAIGDKFGAAVSTDSDEDGGRWVIGMPGRELGTGAVQTLRDVDGAFVFNEEVVAPAGQPGDGFGSAVDITGNKFVVGSPGDDLDPDPIDDGDPADDAADQGSAMLFAYDDSDLPLPAQALRPAVGGEGDRAGTAVAIADGLVIIGSPLADVPGLFGAELSDTGRIDVYRANGASEPLAYAQSQSGNEAATGDQFGRAVSSDGRTIAVGAPARARRAGAAYPLDALGSTIFRSGFESP